MKFRLTSPYGELSEIRNNAPHHGIDFAMPEGTTLRAIADGVVEKIVDYGSENLGKGVFVRFNDGTLGIYGHMSDIDVKQGAIVRAGQLLGESGNTGHSTGAHLHFGLKDADGEWLDPTPLAEQVANSSGGNATIEWFKSRGQVGTFEHADDSVWDGFWAAIGDGLVDALHNGAVALAEFITASMPEIGAFVTVGAGLLIMLSGNITKWLGWWATVMGGAIVWLLNAGS